MNKVWDSFQEMFRKRHHRKEGKAEGRALPQLWHPAVPGPLWDGTRCASWGQIRAYCRVLAREFHPRKIILFGSYAAGLATPESDVDLLVVMPFRGTDTDQVVEIRGRAEAPFPMDLLVWKPGDLRRQDSFARSVLDEGKVIYVDPSVWKSG